MKRSSNRILTTHVGSLIRPPELVAFFRLIEDGKPCDQAAYEAILGQTWRIVGASFAAFLVGEFANAAVLSRMKVATSGRFLWARTIGSTIVGQGLDSAIFITIAFAGTEGIALWPLIWKQWLFKVTFETVATPVTYVVVTALKRLEGVDTFDRDVDLNPVPLPR